jgi:PucR C-terminal helix-turn-helix domain/GGDEF-like domain
MTRFRPEEFIRHWSGRFQADRTASGIVIGFGKRSDEIWQRAFERLKRESPEYSNAVDDEFTKESKSHCAGLLQLIVAIAAAQPVLKGDPFGIVRTHAVWRARHQVPLIASLHAYRLAHRTYWEMTRDRLLPDSRRQCTIYTLSMLADFWLQFFDLVGGILAEAHAVEEGLIVAQGSRRFFKLVDDLLQGYPPNGDEAQRLLALCGFRAGAPMAVALAKPFQMENGEPLDLEVALRSLVRLIEQALPAAIFGKVVDIRSPEVVAIVSSENDTSQMVQRALQDGFAQSQLDGHAARIGLSCDTLEIARLPKALEEARLALDFSSSSKPLLQFTDIDLAELLVRRADHAAFRLIPNWARHFRASSEEEPQPLLCTISAFAESNFNVKQTAQRLSVHTNTVYFRLNRIKKLTGVDPRTYSGMSLLLTVCRLLQSRDVSRSP